MKKDAKYGTAPNHCNGTRCNIHSSFSNNRSAHTSNFFWKFHSESSPQHDMDTSHGHGRHKTISVKITDQKISVERPRRSDECKRRRDRLCSVRGLLAVAWLQPLTLRGGGEVEQEKKRERENLPQWLRLATGKPTGTTRQLKAAAQIGLTLCLTFSRFSYLYLDLISGKHSLVNFFFFSSWNADPVPEICRNFHSFLEIKIQLIFPLQRVTTFISPFDASLLLPSQTEQKYRSARSKKFFESVDRQILRRLCA